MNRGARKRAERIAERSCKWCGRQPFEPRPGKWFGGACCSIECANALSGFRLRRQLLRKKRTKPERILFYFVQNAYPDAVQEHRFGRYVVDVYVPSIHVAFEADGAYWHRNHQTRDAERDATLMAVFALPVVRFAEGELRRIAKDRKAALASTASR